MTVVPSDALALRAQRQWDAVMQERMTVYSEGTGSFDQIDQTNVPCRLIQDRSRPSQAPTRAGQAGSEMLTWPAAVTVPESAQVGLRGQRWNLVHGSYEETRLGPSALLVKHQAEVLRVS